MLHWKIKKKNTDVIRETLAKFSRNGEIHKRSRALRVEHMILLLPLFGLPPPKPRLLRCLQNQRIGAEERSTSHGAPVVEALPAGVQRV